LDGGAENVLQLHSAPAQVWADFGGIGLVLALAFAVLAARRLRVQPPAVIALAGYGVFSLFDWQLDVPVFAFAVAVLAAVVAPEPPAATPRGAARGVGAFALLGLALVVALGRRDPAPELNVRALALAPGPNDDARAITWLRESLALNPDQEIAHFNLGWLLIVRDPAAAEKHFDRAARLVPDKGGVYFGLGLARLNQGRTDAAAAAFALECLNDPAFLTSPWWRDPTIATTRDAARTSFTRYTKRVRDFIAPGWTATQLDRVASLASRLGQVPDGPERAFRRERTGYPVLMRNLDLPTPIDRFVVRESTVAAGAMPLPPKGWLPSPLLLRLLDEPPSPKP
jgi:hypothetical protein